jgi:PAS domain S-box-containing protein
MSIPLHLLLGISRDNVTDSCEALPSQSEEETNDLLFTNQFFKSILDILPNPVFVKDVDSFRFIYLNASAEKSTGYSLEDLAGKTASQIFTKELAEYYNQTDSELIVSGGPIEIETELRKTKNNTLKIFRTNKSLIKDSLNIPRYILENCEDITFNKIESDEADTGEFVFSKLFYSSPIAIAMIGVAENTYIDVNTSFEELTGYSSENILHKRVDEVSLWSDLSSFRELIENAKIHINIDNQELLITRMDGTERTALVSFEYIVSDDSPSWVILTAIDITERKESDERMRIALEKQKDLNVLKHRFIHMISHEFRTPLTSIMLSTDLLRRYSDNWTVEEKAKHFDRIQNTILGMTHLLENVLTVDKLESDKYEFNVEFIDLNPFCKSVIRNIEITNKLDRPIQYLFNSTNPDIYLDETLVAHILTNLLSNAVKYSTPDKDIVLNVDVTDAETVFIVKDFGIGIPKEDIHNLFETFYRASNITTTAGYGLGLGIVKKCVELHKGTIQVESHENIGTTFIIKLPNSSRTK